MLHRNFFYYMNILNWSFQCVSQTLYKKEPPYYEQILYWGRLRKLKADRNCIMYRAGNIFPHMAPASSSLPLVRQQDYTRRHETGFLTFLCTATMDAFKVCFSEAAYRHSPDMVLIIVMHSFNMLHQLIFSRGSTCTLSTDMVDALL